MRDSERMKQESLEENGELPLEKGDRLAMWLSGMLVIGLPSLLIILIIVAVTLLLFARG